MTTSYRFEKPGIPIKRMYINTDKCFVDKVTFLVELRINLSEYYVYLNGENYAEKAITIFWKPMYYFTFKKK